MKIRIVVDTNIIISALLGGKPRFILFDPKLEFITNEFILKEIKKYIPLISRKSGVPRIEVKKGIFLLPLKIVPTSYYKEQIEEAENLIGDIDKEDVEVLALYLKEDTFLWSQDKHFEEVRPKIKLIKTKDFI